MDSWHIYCFIVQVTFMFVFFFSFSVCRTCEWCCINIKTRHVHTNTYWSWWLKIAPCSLLFGQVVLMMTYWVLLVFILIAYWCVNLTYWYVDFLLLDTNRQWPIHRQYMILGNRQWHTANLFLVFGQILNIDSICWH